MRQIRVEKVSVVNHVNLTGRSTGGRGLASFYSVFESIDRRKSIRAEIGADKFRAISEQGPTHGFTNKHPFPRITSVAELLEIL